MLPRALRGGRTLPSWGQGGVSTRAAAPEILARSRGDTVVVVMCTVVSKMYTRDVTAVSECMYMTWRVLHSLVDHVDQAFADGRDLKRLERRPFLLVVAENYALRVRPT